MTVLSVIIPAHNAAPYLGDAIDSVLAELPREADRRSEVIVVDDGSTDATPDVLERYADRVRVIRRTERSSPGTARNTGAATATGDVLAFHDADDLALPGRFSKLLAVLDAEHDLDLAFGNGLKIYLPDTRVRPVIRKSYANRLRRHVGPSEMLLGSWLYPQAMCVRTAGFHALGGFSAEPVEDWDFGLRASLRLRLAFVDVPVFAYRQHAASMTMQRYAFSHTMLGFLERFVAAHPELAQQIGRKEVDHALARYLARTAQHHARSGDTAGARSMLSRAIAFDPASLRYRWRFLKLRMGIAPGA